ncbi:MAG TPA: serine/threonine-protein kinase [Gemmatimonadaceae bacterium]|nr:serine/threonine-protein kinase [Gemmatimonadaceae bacterium]
MNDYLLDRVTIAVGDHYLIEGEVGRGGMAVVYRATDLRLHRTVAIKVLPPDVAFNPDVRTRFIREAQTAAQLNHPNIVQIYSVDEQDGGSVVYFVMAYVDGESLGVRLAREGAWPVDRTIRVLRDVADALAYAHARGVVHRDIKPDNILIDRASGRPMVTDFGIARAAAGETRLTVTGVAVGTPAYMSPEQAVGEREVDGRSDMYSLAVVAYHMLVGEPPFKAGNTPGMLMKHVAERPRPVRERRPDVPAYLGVAIDRGLAKRPEDRFADAAEFRDALDGASAPPPARGARVPPAPLQVLPIPDMPPVPAALAAAPAGAAPMAEYPAPPPGLTRRELREWYRAQRRVLLRQQLQSTAGVGFVMNERIVYPLPYRRFDERPLEERVLSFRRHVFGWMGWSTVLFGVNVATHGPGPWFLIPSALMFIGVLKRAGSIWSDGVGPIDAFKKGIRKKLRAEAAGEEGSAAGQLAARARPQMTSEQAAAQLAPPDVLAGSHGETVRRAAADRMLMREIAAALGPIEREMIPDVGPTVDALAARVGSVATTLHRLDADVSGASLGSLDARIAAMKTEPETAERDRRLQLLQRQRQSLHDLLDRRRSLANQLESASLMLQNLKLDLLKLRSSGLSGSIEDDNTSATQEARALSREIGHVVQAAEDLRKL